jgi:DNA-binding transcriptional regulator YiaG
MTQEIAEAVEKARAIRDRPSPGMIRAVRQTAGLSQEDFAKANKVDRATISRWETGQRTPRGPYLARLLELLRNLQGIL